MPHIPGKRYWTINHPDRATGTHPDGSVRHPLLWFARPWEVVYKELRGLYSMDGVADLMDRCEWYPGEQAPQVFESQSDALAMYQAGLWEQQSDLNEQSSLVQVALSAIDLDENGQWMVR